ncbi:putative MFS transporter, AGZA family, xanthine/uracil permease [Clostridium cochlearium]|uniref:MFS transporter, AGZA family, xanthine/uracil permease n=1 Tax=Clostridium cochlearium TaxID=1494 RepID=A0ABY0QLB6_CLOCO|nr:NCS2 family permease [Clostridium cochlearium]SDL14651.1 putative MFS transporter, AGZA family, xanthine/uracil permease [Clostridium cochlearium]
MRKIIENIFYLTKYKTTVKGELLAGLTGFFSVVYIIAVNSSILSDAGIPLEAGIIATILVSFLGCIIMGLLGNVPIMVVPGMGVNALFSYTIIKSMGLSVQQALTAVVIAGAIFSIITFTRLGDIITKSISHSLKEAITVGIGIFITFIGFQKGGIIVSHQSNFVTLGDLKNPLVLATLINLAITLFLFIKDIKGNFLISIILGTGVSYLLGLVDVSSINFQGLSFQGYGDVFFNLDFGGITTISFWTAVFSLVLVLVFENLGLLNGYVNIMLKQPEKFKNAYKSTALSSITCGILGTSPTIATVESAAAIAAGGKTGLTSIFTGILFILSIFFLPLIKVIPNSAVAPILIIIGSLMIKNVLNINFNDFTEGFPAFLIITMIPLTYSIVDGMAFGFIAYPIAKLAANKKEDVSLPMYIISIIFLINFILSV